MSDFLITQPPSCAPVAVPELLLLPQTTLLPYITHIVGAFHLYSLQLALCTMSRIPVPIKQDWSFAQDYYKGCYLWSTFLILMSPQLEAAPGRGWA